MSMNFFGGKIWFLCFFFALPSNNNISSRNNAVVAFSTPSKTIWYRQSIPKKIALHSTSTKDEDGVLKTDAVICGGGPAGLLSAIMLAQKFPEHKIKLFDRLSTPPSPTDETIWCDIARFYLIGLGPRGQRALTDFGVWEDVEACCVGLIGRKDWSPGSDEGVETIFTKEDKKVKTQVLPRDKLAGVLHKHILDNYSDTVELNYGYEVHPLDFGSTSDANDDSSGSVLVEVVRCTEEVARMNFSQVKTASYEQVDILCSAEGAEVQTISTNLLIAADGAARTVANVMARNDRRKYESMDFIRKLFAEKPFAITRFEDDNKRVYKTVPMKLPSDWRPDLNYGARTKGSVIIFDALPANPKGEYAGVLLLKADDPLASSDTEPEYLRQRLDEELPQFSKLITNETIANVAKKPPSYLPGFRFAGPRLNEGDRTIILGDCAHSVKPYFGLGANSALEDVKILGDMIDSTDSITDAVYKFSKHRALESKILVSISRDLDRPGLPGFFTFLLPIILDGIFSKVAPQLFMPNVIAMLQREEYTFQQVARRKRLDRIGQILILSGTITAIVAALKFIINLLSLLLGQSN